MSPNIEIMCKQMNEESTKQHIDYINTMTHEDMARMWRFAPSGHPYFNVKFPEIVSAFSERWKGFGGMTTVISKRIGWDA